MMESLKNKKNDSERLLFAVIIISAFFLRLICLLNSDNFHGIAAGKIFEALYLVKHPEEIWAWIVPAHGPVHIYLLAVLFSVFGKYLLLGRLVSFFAGIIVFFPYYQLVKFYFNRSSALLSCFIAAFFYLHVIYCVLSTAESIFILFLFTGFYFYSKYSNSQKIKELVICGSCLGLASMCRFEGGLFILLLSLFLIKKPKRMLIFLISAGILPLIWMIFNFILYGDFLYFLSSSDKIVKYEFDSLRAYGSKYTAAERIFYWFIVLKDFFGYLLFVFGCFGFFRSLRKSQAKLFSVLFACVLIFFICKTFYKELAMQPRYGMSLGFLFIPFISETVLRGYTRLKIICKNKIYLLQQFKMIFILFLFAIVLRGAYLSIVYLPHTPLWVKKTAEFLADRMQENKNESVYIDSDDDNFIAPIKVLSGLDVDIFVELQAEGTHRESIELSDLKNLKYRVLISKNRKLDLREIFRNSDCKIYEVQK